MRNPFILILLFFTLMSSIDANASLQTKIATVLMADGSVTSKDKSGKERQLKRRSPLYTGETINVGEKGIVQLRFSDASLLTLKANSSFRVDSYKNDPQEPVFKATLLNGAIRTATGAISKTRPEGYEVKTRVAIVGVRGTFYSALFDDATSRLNVSYYTGSGFLENALGRMDLGLDERYDYGEVGGEDDAPLGALEEVGAFDDYEDDDEDADFDDGDLDDDGDFDDDFDDDLDFDDDDDGFDDEGPGILGDADDTEFFDDDEDFLSDEDLDDLEFDLEDEFDDFEDEFLDDDDFYDDDDIIDDLDDDFFDDEYPEEDPEEVP